MYAFSGVGCVRMSPLPCWTFDPEVVDSAAEFPLLGQLARVLSTLPPAYIASGGTSTFI